MQIAITLIVALVAQVTSKPAAVRYVNIQAPAGGDGQTWATAYNDFSVALANPLPAEEYWVAQGTYRTPVNLSFVLPPRTAFYGGFNGTETSLGQRDIAANPTILSGDALGNDLTKTFSLADNSHVIVAKGSDRSRVDGFTIRDGFAFGDHNVDSTGGGILVIGGSPVIINCTIIHNWTVSGAEGIGGGIALHQSEAVIINCDFAENCTIMGGGIQIIGGHAIVAGCTFRDHTAVELGGGIGVWGGGCVVVDCVFDDLEGDGAVFLMDHARASISNSTFQHCQWSIFGGSAVFAVDESLAKLRSCVFVDCEEPATLADPSSKITGVPK